ncbi:MAG TPA: Ig-like domain-containing protein [Kineosporiaceae bacterium]|nr:Ig-like domain-containing protein [Kineosporiaceae bacterium]
MRRWHRAVIRRAPDDGGFTLVEVVVALVLLTMVTVGASTLFMRGVSTSASLDRRQEAVAVAGQSLELVRSLSPVRDTSGNSKLVAGRTKGVVDAQLAAAVADLSQTDEEYDTTATASSTPVLPLAATTTVAGITYTAQRIVGSCWRPSAGGACVKAAVKANPSLFMYRVLIQVTWSEGGATTCSGTACSYVLSTLIDPSSDPTFNLNATNAAWPGAPVLQAITATTPMNTPVTIDLASSVVAAGTPLVASIVSTSQGANASLVPNTTTVTVTPANGFWSGQDIVVNFTLTDPYSQSSSGTLTVHVSPPPGPTAAAGAAATAFNTPVSIDLSSYVSGGSGPLHYAVSNPSGGSLGAVSGSTVTFTPNSTFAGNATFSYTVSDGYGQSSAATVMVTVATPPAPTAGNATIHASVGTKVTVQLSTYVTGTGTLTYSTSNFTTTPYNSNNKLGNVNASGQVSFTPANGWTGTATFRYTVQDAYGQSASGTITVIEP